MNAHAQFTIITGYIQLYSFFISFCQDHLLFIFNVSCLVNCLSILYIRKRFSLISHIMIRYLWDTYHLLTSSKSIKREQMILQPFQTLIKSQVINQLSLVGGVPKETCITVFFCNHKDVGAIG